MKKGFAKHALISTILSIFSISISAQEITSITHDNYVSESIKDIFIEMPDYREINSGTKLVVTYEGEWPAEMKGAFEYAVKIWEEVLPLSLPIKITAKIEQIRGNNILSRVGFNNRGLYDRNENYYEYPLSMIKAVALQEYHRRKDYRFIDSLPDTYLFNVTDMTIIYNKNILNQFDFSLDGTTDLNKYDFVTVVLRDIAIGLGINTSFIGDKVNNKILMTNSGLTPFETLIMNTLGTTDAYEAYTKATKGFLDIPLLNWGSVQFDTLTLYAPEDWSNSSSLRYFIPDENPITKLLTYDFGKGYVMRDLSGVNWDDMFCGLLDWRTDLTVGGTSASIGHSGTSEDILPYKGNFTISFNDTDQATFERQNLKISSNISSTTTDMPQSVASEASDSVYDFCKRYDLYCPDGPVFHGVSLSAMKKDGSWDCIYKNETDELPITIKIEDLALNFDESEYARGTTGGLRYRLTLCEHNFNSSGSLTLYNYSTKYFTRDYIPQKAFIKYTPETTSEETNQITLAADDDWFVDVKVGISNLEGTTRVYVEQLDEGEELPFQYEAEDFRKGYFIANLDRECSTTLTVICYNDNGFQRSNTIVIPAIGYPTEEVSFTKVGETISIDGLSANELENDNLTYSIRNLTNAPIAVTGQSLDSNKIDVSNLSKGIYVLTIANETEQIGTYKFVK